MLQNSCRSFTLISLVHILNRPWQIEEATQCRTLAQLDRKSTTANTKELQPSLHYNGKDG